MATFGSLARALALARSHARARLLSPLPHCWLQGGGAKVRIASGGHSTVRDFAPAAFKFALVRHPVERFLSAFNFVREGGANHPLKGKVPQAQRWQPFLAKFGGLSEFLADADAVRTITHPHSGHTHFWSLRHWVCSSSFSSGGGGGGGGGGGDDAAGIDFFIRQEHLEHDFARLCKLLRLSPPPAEIPKFNVTGSRATVSAGDRHRLEVLLRDDIELYERLLARCSGAAGAAGAAGGGSGGGQAAWAKAKAKIGQQFDLAQR